MDHPTSQTVVAVQRRGARSLLIPFPFVCFTLTLITDLAYWQTSDLMWNNFSSWLLFAGLVFGGLAALLGLVDLFRKSARPTAGQVIGYLVVLALAFVNSFVHAGDGWTAIVPYGIALSALTVLVMLVVFSFRRSTVVATDFGARTYA